MASGIFPEWLNVNSGRAFPLAENSSRLDATGTVPLPNSLIVAAQICMTSVYADGIFFVSQLGAFPDHIAITISFQDSSNNVRAIATVTVLVASHVPYQSYAFAGAGNDGVLLGSLTLGDLTDTLQGVPGLVQFTAAATPFEVSALFVSTPMLDGISLYTGTTLVQTFTQYLRLRSGLNVRLSRIDDFTIQIDAIQGQNLVEPSNCENAVAVPPPIRTINNVPPDDNGNFNLEGDECLDVQVAAAKISLTDVCSSSCCGCTELEALEAGLVNLESQIASLRTSSLATIQQLSAMVATLAANV